MALKKWGKPLVLKPGDCLVYGVVPDGYELVVYGAKERQLKFEVNKTYVFRLTGAYQTTDTYEAAFCIGENSNGSRVFLQYTPLPGGGEVIPSCDARRNGNVPGQVVPTN